MAGDERLGVPAVGRPLNVIVDYAGPNVAKAMHVGHLRATIIGDTIKRLFCFAGHEVLGDAHFGDWGLQMGMLIVATRRRHPDLAHFDGDYEGPYEEPLAITLADLQEWYPDMAREVAEDEEVAAEARRATTDLQSGRPGYVALWEHFVRVSRASQEQDFSDLGVEFDLWYGESTVRDMLRPLVDDTLARGIAVRSEGAVVIDVSRPDDKAEITPLVLETSHGAFLYGTTDVATIQLRVSELGADLILYVVDSRQSYHLEQVFRAARRAGLSGGAAMEHIGFGTMNGPDGTPFKTREGGVLRLGDLIEMVTNAAAARLEESDLAALYPGAEQAVIARQVGIAALKFGDLVNNRTSNYVFDVRRFTALEGKTGPYLQMAAVRMDSILARAARRGLAPGAILAPHHETETRLLLRLLQLPEVIDRAMDLRAPNHLAEFRLRGCRRLQSFLRGLPHPDRARPRSAVLVVGDGPDLPPGAGGPARPAGYRGSGSHVGAAQPLRYSRMTRSIQGAVEQGRNVGGDPRVAGCPVLEGRPGQRQGDQTRRPGPAAHHDPDRPARGRTIRRSGPGSRSPGLPAGRSPRCRSEWPAPRSPASPTARPPPASRRARVPTRWPSLQPPRRASTPLPRPPGFRTRTVPGRG